MDNFILVKRQGACGDVLLSAAVVPAVKKIYPGRQVYFETKCPSVLIGNPHIDFIVAHAPPYNYEVVIDLDMAYEKKPHQNILISLAEAANIPVGWCSPSVARAKVNKPLLDKYAVIHAGKTSWAGRNWDEEKWHEIAIRFHKSGYQIVCVGRKPDLFVPSDVDCRDITSVQELATIIEDAKIFVGIDSLPFHIAQVVGTPCVTFFGSIDPEMRIISPSVRAVTAKSLSCLGCHHRQESPVVTLLKCPLGTLECESSVSVDDMWKEIINELGITPA